MSSSNGEFDDSSTTRGASDVSATNKLDSSPNDLLKEKENVIVNDTRSDMTKSINSTITTASTDGNNTNGSSCNEKTQQRDNRALYSSQDDEEIAFKSQFDEIKCASRMFENSKNNAYNRFQGFAGRAPSKRVNENGVNSFHQRSHSYSTYSQQTSRHMLKPQRSISSINGLSFNGDSSAFSAGKFYSSHGPSTPFTSYGFDSFDNKDDIFPSNSVNGNDDVFMRYKDIENGGGRFGFNNGRFGSNSEEWDDSSSGYPQTPLSSGPFTPLPLTPSSTYSNRSTYFAQPNSLLDDEELVEKAKLLEEERRLLSIQQRQLDNAIAAHKLWYNNSDPELNETDNRYKTTPPPIPTRGNSIPSLQRKFLGNKLTVPPPRFQNSQEPIGPPTRKSGYNTPPPSITPTDSNSSSPTFSLFSNPPALSFSHNLMSQQQKHKQTMFPDNHGSGLNGKFSPFNDYPLTPSSSPPKTKNNDEGCFGFGYTSKNNIWAENNYFYSPQETKRNDFYSEHYNFLTPTIPISPAGHFRAPLYSSPVDEREESLFASEYFSLQNKRDYENNFILML